MSDLNHQDLTTPQSGVQPKPVTIASADTIAPTTMLSFITGTTTVNTITPPVTGYHFLIFRAGAANVYGTGDNIVNGFTATSGEYHMAIYDPIAAKYTLVLINAADS